MYHHGVCNTAYIVCVSPWSVQHCLLRLGILRKSWRVFHDKALLGRCFLGFVLPVLEYCSVVWCSAPDTHLKLLDRAVSGARFLTGGVFEWDIFHRRSVAVLCILYKIRCNPVHPLNGAIPGPYVPVRVTLGALIAHRYTYAPPRCRTLQYSRSFIPFSSVPLERSCLTSIRWCGTGGFQEQGQCFFIGLSCSIPTVVLYSFPLSLHSVYGLVLWAGVFGLIGCTSLSLSLALPTFFNDDGECCDVQLWWKRTLLI